MSFSWTLNIKIKSQTALTDSKYIAFGLQRPIYLNLNYLNVYQKATHFYSKLKLNKLQVPNH